MAVPWGTHPPHLIDKYLREDISNFRLFRAKSGRSKKVVKIFMVEVISTVFGVEESDFWNPKTIFYFHVFPSIYRMAQMNKMQKIQTVITREIRCRFFLFWCHSKATI